MTFSRRAPHVTLATLIALILAVALAVIAPDARGQTPSPSPSGSTSPSPPGSGPAPAGPAVTLLNPSAAYDDPPKVSDRFDGVDGSYTIVARTEGSASSAILEAALAPQQSDGTYANDVTIGTLFRVSPGSDVWELDWDIPASIPEGPALFTVRAFVDTPAGFVETGSDAAPVDVSYSDPASPPIGAYETTELLWPEQDGPLGWYKPRVGAWRVAIEGRTSPGANYVQLFVSSTPPDEELRFTPCGTIRTVPRQGFNTYLGRCSLAATVLPSQVRAVAAVAEFRQEDTGLRLFQAADVSAVQSYDVDPHDLSVTLVPPIRRAPAPAVGCQRFVALVTDEHDRPVIGANVDVHASGPGDELVLSGTTVVLPSGHATEVTGHCPAAEDLPLPTEPRSQGDHNIPGSNDVKHMETNQGTGLDALSQLPGQAQFGIASQRSGFTEITVWVDDEPISRETDQRPPDSDTLDEGEPVGHGRVQWYPGPLTVSLDPLGGSVPAGTCFPYTVKVRAGTSAVPGINVDLHATGPDDALDFCNPLGASERRAPSAGTGGNTHEAEETSESHHVGSNGPGAQHTEGETDGAGNFVVGLTSPAPGDSTVVAWVDGEAGSDDDTQVGAETSASGTISWASSAAEADLSFVNPSPYGPTQGGGGGTQVPDRGGATTVLVRVDMAEAVSGVDVLLSRDGGRTFAFLGEAQRIGSTDLYGLRWQVDLADGPGLLRARLRDTAITEDLNVTIGSGELLPSVPNPAFETLRLTRPEPAGGAPFSRRSTIVAGTATPGAEGVDVFYTKVAAKDTPRLFDWIPCGYADLSGTGAQPQDFSTLCTLAGADQAGQVTGIAAITYDCTVDGCNPVPNPSPPADDAPPPPREQGQKDTGQAVRVFGYEANPLLAIEPAEAEAVTGDCRRFEVLLRDQTGQALGDENVDLHLDGPGSSAHFCRPPDVAPTLRPPGAGGHAPASDPALQLEAPHAEGEPLHTEGETLPDGTLVFGVTSDAEGDVQLTAWVDRGDDDVAGAGEPLDTTLVHWIPPRGCSFVGTEAADVLVGTSGPDVFCGLGGADEIRGLGGSDTVFGGMGADRIYGGRGGDLLKGARGRDLLNGGPGRDECLGGPGRDGILRCESGGRTVARRSGV